MPDIDLGRYELDEDSNGNLVARDPNDNVVAQWDETDGAWDWGQTEHKNIGSLSADETSLTGPFNRSPGATGYIIRTGGKSVYAESTVNYDNLVTVYDIEKDEHQTLSAMNTDRTDHVAVTHNGSVWVFGGTTERDGSVEEYDIATDTWTEKTSLNVGRIRLSTNGVVINGKVFVCGGFNDGSRLTDVEEYDLSNDTVTAKTDMPQSQSFPMQAKYGGMLYLITGNTDSGDGGIIQRYDPSTDSWDGPSNFTSHPELATDGGGVQIGDEFHFIGGWNTDTGEHIDSHYKYDIPNDEWTKVRDLPGSWSHGKLAWDGTYLWRFMGRTINNSKESFTNTVWRWHRQKELESVAQNAPARGYNFALTYTTETPYGRME